MFTRTTSFDLMHVNAITVIPRDIAGFSKKGDLLISSHNFDLVAVIDPLDAKILWLWGPGQILKQHHPTLLDNNNILIFDNGAPVKRPYSRVIEVNPFTKEIVWEYKASPPEKFFSVSRGAAQRLPNGNTLITNSDSGYVFEVTKNGEIVWEFYCPEIDGKEEKRAAIYRFIRITEPEKYPRLKNLE
ncbi:MAG: arylsulfotransferase family protein [Candidatus Omnitrophica bacterium]|nr:arylsulfotransferase family protein [Candidatus Omnitrophota bacterium]